MSDQEISPRDVYVRGDSRSRSRSPHSDRDADERRSRSRSRGRDYRGRDHRSSREHRRSRSRSPMSNSRKRHIGDRDRPEPSRCIGVFGLSIYTNERELRDFFSKYGHVQEVQIVYDAQTGRSRGFGFVYYENQDDAYEAKEKANGMEIDGRKIRVDFSITKRAHTPTPGVYMGRPTRRANMSGGRGGPGGNGYYGGGRDRGFRRRYTRSPSPYRSRGGRDRYRERSYSPRRYY